MTPKEILIKARDHISNPKMWKKGGSTIEDIDNGFPCCAMSSIVWAEQETKHLFGSTYISKALILLKEALEQPNIYVFQYNDLEKTNHMDIMALFDRAILEIKPL